MSENRVTNISGATETVSKTDGQKNTEIKDVLKQRQEDRARIAELLRKGYEEANPEDYAVLMKESATRRAEEAAALVKRVMDGNASCLDYLRHGYAKIDGKSTHDALTAEIEAGNRTDADKVQN